MTVIKSGTTLTTAYSVTGDTTGTLVLQTGATPTTAVTIDGSQNVGIGTSSPTQRLQLTGSAVTLKLEDTSVAARNVTSITANGAASTISWDADNVVSGSYLSFVGDGSEKARIDSSGNLLVGTTSSGLINSNGIVLNPNGNSSLFQHASGIASGTGYLVFGYNGSIIGSVTQNGTTGVLYNLTSDYRLKNNQQPLTGAKEFVMALQPKKWEWWDGSGEGVGFIAHEFMEVAKYSGHGEKDAVDEEGKIIAQSIQPSSSEVMANLVSLLQEQQAMIEQLKADIAQLKGAA